MKIPAISKRYGELGISSMTAEYNMPQQSQRDERGSFRRKLLLLTVVTAACFIAVCWVDYLLGFLYSGFVSDIVYTLWVAFTSKPIRIRDIALVFLFLWLIGVVVLAWREWLQGQKNKIHARPLSREELRRAIQAQYQKRFWVSFLLYSTVIVVSILAYLVLKESFIWYNNDPWFTILRIMSDVFPFAIVVLWIGGVIVLLFNQWRQSSADIVGLVDSIEQMQEGVSGNQISVPENLIELRPVIQNMFDTSCRNREAAAEAEKRKRDLILYLAHDLKTPLTSVIGYLSLLNDNDDLTEEQKKEYSVIARDKALRLESLINQFFEISRFSLHEAELNPSTFNLNLLLLQLCDQFYPLVEEQGKKIELNTDEEPLLSESTSQENLAYSEEPRDKSDAQGFAQTGPSTAVTSADSKNPDIEIYGDADMLARVFENILRNAIAYSYPQSTIIIQTSSGFGAARITIKNRGEDIPESQLNQVFEKFYRLDESRSTDSGGAGLGLAIAKEIVSMHHGTIAATSSDETTTFTVTLPLPGNQPFNTQFA